MKTTYLRGKGTMDRKEGGPGRKSTSWRAGGGDECSDRHTDNEIGEDGHIGCMAVRGVIRAPISGCLS